MPVHVSSTVVLIIRRSKLYYTKSDIVTPAGGRPVHRLRENCVYGTATYGCDDTRCCLILLYSNTCFEHCCAHHQEVKIVLYSICYRHTCRWPSPAHSPLSTCATDGHLQV